MLTENLYQNRNSGRTELMRFNIQRHLMEQWEKGEQPHILVFGKSITGPFYCRCARVLVPAGANWVKSGSGFEYMCETCKSSVTFTFNNQGWEPK